MKKNNTSKSSIKNLTYTIPEILDDREAIDCFLESNKGKKVIVVQGLGFVGAVMSLVCANALSEEYAVIGIDLPNPQSYWKICSINDGIFPIVSADKKVDEYFEKAKKKNNFYATYDTYAFSKADVIIVDINLDVQKRDNHIFSDNIIDYSVDLSGFKVAMKSIGDVCKEDALILIETTVPPGTSILARDIIQESLQNRNLPIDLIKIGHSYERVMPGPNYIDSIQNFYRVYSGINTYSADHVETFLKTIIRIDEYPLTRLKNTNSTEISKVLENSFRAMNIAFIVEWSRYAEEAGVDLYEVVNAIRMRPTHKNIMLPGLGVGGYCLTKDPLLASWSKQNLIGSNESLQMSENAVTTNDKMPLYAYKLFKSFINQENICRNVYLFGVSYAPDVGDTRYSPVELFFNLLKNDGYVIHLNDPFVHFWEELSLDVSNHFEHINNSLDALIFTTGHSFYKNNEEMINLILGLEHLLIFDTIGILSEPEILKLSQKHTVKVLGRGDLRI
jgi:UDP-N-acetyl-D-glucosamine dehydrogenase